MSHSHTKKLGQLAATAICGNDISSSCLYVSALAIIYSGAYAWLALLVVGLVLYLFRNIYGEVVGALPLNGGAYNALLNTTSKSMASLAACLTLISYMATAVISASEATHYVHHLYEGFDITAATIGLLAFFMCLTIIGIGESSIVAIVIFITHLVSLTVLVLIAGFFVFNHGWETFSINWNQPVEGGFWNAIFFGFAAAMLGISGFESSANFVEEQAPGVFPKTLRNMWMVVSVFNPLIAFLVLATLSISDVSGNQNALLAYMGEQVGGHWLSILISIDAAMVLSGAVLTSFVGVGGLMQRMTLDRILPQFLLKQNKRGSAYWIMIIFFLLCTSVLFITRGELGALAGVYTISFLSVMILFAVGNVLLKARRSKLPRPVKASPFAIMIAVIAVGIALAGNILLKPEYFIVFLEYFFPTLAVVAFMLFRIPILRLIFSVLRYFNVRIRMVLTRWERSVNKVIHGINSQEFVFFTKGDTIATLNKVMLYVRNNENTNKIRIVTVLEDSSKKMNEQFLMELDVLDREYPEIDIHYIELTGKFGPELIENLSKEWKIPMNFMFIGSPGDRFPYRIEQLGGVRLII